MQKMSVAAGLIDIAPNRKEVRIRETLCRAFGEGD
jgi:hypothetical protein